MRAVSTVASLSTPVQKTKTREAAGQKLVHSFHLTTSRGRKKMLRDSSTRSELNDMRNLVQSDHALRDVVRWTTHVSACRLPFLKMHIPLFTSSTRKCAGKHTQCEHVCKRAHSLISIGHIGTNEALARTHACTPAGSRTSCSRMSTPPSGWHPDSKLHQPQCWTLQQHLPLHTCAVAANFSVLERTPSRRSALQEHLLAQTQQTKYSFIFVDSAQVRIPELHLCLHCGRQRVCAISFPRQPRMATDSLLHGFDTAQLTRQGLPPCLPFRSAVSLRKISVLRRPRKRSRRRSTAVSHFPKTEESSE